MATQQMKIAKALRLLDHLKQIQGTTGNWDHDPYMLGIFNGLELATAVLQNREPMFKEAPLLWKNEPPAVIMVARSYIEGKL